MILFKFIRITARLIDCFAQRARARGLAASSPNASTQSVTPVGRELQNNKIKLTNKNCHQILQYKKTKYHKLQMSNIKIVHS